jgi:CheY-like chemotaxis protein
MLNSQSDLEGKSILVIDDDRFSRKMIESILHKVGCEVLTAKDAFDGWCKIISFKPDAVIIDVVMPYVNGITLYDYLHHNPETDTLPCLFLTSEATSENVRKITRFSGVSLLVKQTVKAKTIYNKLSKVLQNP